MSQLEPRLEAIRLKYDLQASDFWELPQRKGTWIIKHAALEKVAAAAHIIFDTPQVIEANTEKGIAVLSVRGVRYPERIDAETGRKWYDQGEKSDWATGEAAPNNNKNAYPWAMAEKRAKDRVVLKLTGIEAYSEDEADDFKQGRADAHTDASEAIDDTVARTLFPVIQTALRACTTTKQLEGAWSRYLPVMASWSDRLQEDCDTVYQDMRKHLAEHDGDARKASRDTLEGILRAAVSMDDLKAKWQEMEPALKKIGKDDVGYLNGVKEEMKAVIAKVGTMPNFDTLEPTHEQKIAGTI